MTEEELNNIEVEKECPDCGGQGWGAFIDPRDRGEEVPCLRCDGSGCVPNALGKKIIHMLTESTLQHSLLYLVQKATAEELKNPKIRESIASFVKFEVSKITGDGK